MGIPIVVQWLGLNALGPGQSLVRELCGLIASHTAQPKKKNTHKNCIIYCIILSCKISTYPFFSQPYRGCLETYGRICNQETKKNFLAKDH